MSTETMLVELMPFRVRRVLLLASRYDAFMLEEDGRLSEMLAHSYSQRLLPYVPEVNHACTAAAALKNLEHESCDLVITLMRLEGMDPFAFAARAREQFPDLPVVILAYNTPPLQRLLERRNNPDVERIFVWQGDGRILPAIIQLTEDRRNAAADSIRADVQHILLAAGSPTHYSRLLPFLYEEITAWTSAQLDDDLTFNQRRLRLFAAAQDSSGGITRGGRCRSGFIAAQMQGAIVDLRLPQGGTSRPENGLELLRDLRRRRPGLPVLVHSSENDEAMAVAVRNLNAEFLDKSTPTPLETLRPLIPALFGFAPIRPDGWPGNAPPIRDLDQLLSASELMTPQSMTTALRDGSLDRWLRARGEFTLADRLQAIVPAPGKEFDPRPELKRMVCENRRQSRHGSLSPYTRRFSSENYGFSRIGSGSIGGRRAG